MICRSDHCRYLILACVCGLFSAGGIASAIYNTHNSADGGRGGAIAVALALGALFISRNYGEMVFRALTSLPSLSALVEALKAGTEPAEPKELTVGQLTKAFASQLTAEAKAQRIQNYYLAVVTFFSTMVWGFGDIFACWAAHGLQIRCVIGCN